MAQRTMYLAGLRELEEGMTAPPMEPSEEPLEIVKQQGLVQLSDGRNVVILPDEIGRQLLELSGDHLEPVISLHREAMDHFDAPTRGARESRRLLREWGPRRVQEGLGLRAAARRILLQEGRRLKRHLAQLADADRLWLQLTEDPHQELRCAIDHLGPECARATFDEGLAE